MDRTLSLRRETLTELNPVELGMVVAAGPSDDPDPTPPVWLITHDCPTRYCVPSNIC